MTVTGVTKRDVTAVTNPLVERDGRDKPCGLSRCHGGPVTAWRTLSRPPRRLWVLCSSCRYSAINEDKALRGWQESTATPRRYRCSECAEVDP